MSEPRARESRPPDRPATGEPDARRADPALAARELSAGRTPRARSLIALARATGNRRAARLLQRRPTTVTGRFLRVQVVGHASARWRSARTAEQAAGRNQELSERRAAAVKEVILQELAGRLPVPVDVDVCVVDDEDVEGAAVAGHGEGSREAVKRTEGDRRSNEQRDRRVDVEAELVTTERGRERVLVRRSARTRDWRFTVTRFKDFGVGYARVELELEITNMLTGRRATGRARLEGLGKGGLAPDKGGIGPANIELSADRPVGFADFDGSLIRVYLANVKLGVGWKGVFVVFGGIRKNPVLVESDWGLGLKPGGYGVVGDLRLDSVPDDFTVTEEDGTPFKRRHGRGKSLRITFATGSDTVSAADADRVRAFADEWARRFD